LRGILSVLKNTFAPKKYEISVKGKIKAKTARSLSLIFIR
jgi:hypothetical protein